jgi:release factor glutamine methyltransferase
MTIHEAKQQMIKNLRSIYEDGEAMNIADLVIEYVTGKSRIEQVKNREMIFPVNQLETFKRVIERLKKNEPIQYILGEAWFAGMKFHVDKTVLIPRPETEELINWIIKTLEGWQMPENRNYKVIDIGTGSGCISIALRKQLPQFFETWACDINDQVLTIARKNADELHALVDFVAMDFLDGAQRRQLPQVDVIVSNPPYVPLLDKYEMKPNVVDFEPHTALFVPDNDPLVFYRAIADFAKEKLYPAGLVFVEIHESSGKKVSELFRLEGFSVELRKDMQGKDRMLKCNYN